MLEIILTTVAGQNLKKIEKRITHGTQKRGCGPMAVTVLERVAKHAEKYQGDTVHHNTIYTCKLSHTHHTLHHRHIHIAKTRTRTYQRQYHHHRKHLRLSHNPRRCLLPKNFHFVQLKGAHRGGNDVTLPGLEAVDARVDVDGVGAKYRQQTCEFNKHITNTITLYQNDAPCKFTHKI